MQYEVPKFIEIEDKILGPLTWRQFSYGLIAGGFLLIFYFALNKAYFIILTVIVGSIASLFMFVKIHGQPFPVFFKSVLKYISSPPMFFWRSGARKQTRKQNLLQKTKPEKPKEKELTRSRLKDLSSKLDIGYSPKRGKAR